MRPLHHWWRSIPPDRHKTYLGGTLLSTILCSWGASPWALLAFPIVGVTLLWYHLDLPSVFSEQSRAIIPREVNIGVAALAVQGAIYEEVVRNIALHMGSWCSPWAAIIVTSILFGLSHALGAYPKGTVVRLLLLSLPVGYLSLYFGVRSAIAAHVLYNLLGTLGVTSLRPHD